MPSPLLPVNNARGIAAMCAAMAFFVANDTLVKLAAVSLPAHQIMFLRGIVASTLILGFVALKGIRAPLSQCVTPLILFRGGLEVVTAYTFIIALGLMGIADVTAILLLSPLLITALSALLLKEDVRWRRWAAVGVGFAGMLLVVRPGEGAFQYAALMALLSACCVAVRDLATRRLPHDTPSVIVATSGILIMTASAGLMCLVLPWVAPEGRTLLLLTAAGLAILCGNIAIIMAFRNVDVSAVSPFRYTVMVWAVIAGFLVFGDVPTPLAWVGIALIVASGLYTMYREAAVASRARRLAAQS